MCADPSDSPLALLHGSIAASQGTWKLCTRREDSLFSISRSLLVVFLRFIFHAHKTRDLGGLMLTDFAVSRCEGMARKAS